MTGIQKVIKVVAICLAVFIIATIVNCIVLFVGTFINVDTKRESFTENFTDVRNLDIDIASADIIIEKGTEFKVEAENVSSNLKVKQHGSTLTLKENFGFFGHSFKSGKITITVAEGVLNELNIDTGAGAIEISDITVKLIDVDQGAGSIRINNLVSDKTIIDGGAGEIDIKNSKLNNLDLDAGVGRTTIEGTIYGKSDIDCGVGEINLNLVGDESVYKIVASKGIGNININDVNYKSDETYGYGSNKIDIDGGVGAINIKLDK